MGPSFSILIPTWKNLPYLDLCVRSLRRHSAAEHEILVFFNEFDAEAEQWLQGQPVTALRADRNLGVCPALNRLAAKATRDFVCFLNDDMVPLPGWDTALALYADLAEIVWLSGTAVEAAGGNPGYLGGCDYGDRPETFQEERLLADCGKLKRPYNVVSTWTPLAVPRKAWEAVDGFDEAYFPGAGSEVDFAMKLYRQGCRHFIGVGASLVYHFSRRTVGRFDRSVEDESRRLFERKWGMSRRRFLRRVLRRESVITPELLDRMDRHASA